MSEDLSPENLLLAYANGYFPMADEVGNILWFSPDPRAIIELDEFHVSKSLKKWRERHHFELTINKDFYGVIAACADREVTWLHPSLQAAYEHLHRVGFADSFEVWHEQKLVGGVYGVKLGKAFFAESMFHRQTNASKLALWFLVEYLQKQQFTLFECQYLTPHLQSLGAKEISKKIYLKKLHAALASVLRPA
jgi:leucyl/phenylalanyl-tRNA--protein transferase